MSIKKNKQNILYFIHSSSFTRFYIYIGGCLFFHFLGHNLFNKNVEDILFNNVVMDDSSRKDANTKRFVS